MTGRIPWHAGQWSVVEAWRSSQRMPHAVLCAGPRGLGKQIFVQQLAASLLCEAVAERGAACGNCAACHLLAAGSHPDLFSVEPEEGKLSIGIDAVRELSRLLGLTSSRRGSKIAILYPAEAMTRGSANSLLKTLEEPPTGSYLFLISHAPAMLPTTVRSRCQQLAFHASFETAGVDWLSARIDDDHDPEMLLRLAQGAPLRALEFLEQDGLQNREAILEGIGLLTNRRADPIAMASNWHAMGLPVVSYWMHGVISDLIRLASGDSPPFLLNGDQRPLLQPLAKRLDYRVLFSLLDWCLDARRVSDRGQNLNQQLLLESLAIAWYRAG